MNPKDSILHTAGELTGYLKSYADLQLDQIKLEVAENSAKTGSGILTTLILLFTGMMVMAFAMITLGFILSSLLGSFSLGFLIVTLLMALITGLLYFFRRQLITNPLLGFMLSDTESGNIRTLKDIKRAKTNKNLLKAQALNEFSTTLKTSRKNMEKFLVRDVLLPTGILGLVVSAVKYYFTNKTQVAENNHEIQSDDAAWWKPLVPVLIGIIAKNIDKSGLIDQFLSQKENTPASNYNHATKLTQTPPVPA